MSSYFPSAGSGSGSGGGGSPYFSTGSSSGLPLGTPSHAKQSKPGWFQRAAASAADDLKGVAVGLGDLAVNEYNAAKATIEHPIGSNLPAWEHPLRGAPAGSSDAFLQNAAKGIGSYYGTTYSSPGNLLHVLNTDPLGPLLDALTVATGGAGLVGKAGRFADAAGFANDVGKAKYLTVPDWADEAGQVGSHIPVGRTSGNPLIKARQVAINDLKNRLPGGTPIIGSDARALKAMDKEAMREGARMEIAGEPFRVAFGKLSKDERVAWHMISRGTTPSHYLEWLGTQEKVSPAMVKTLDRPGVLKAAENPSPNLQVALNEGRMLSDRLTELKVGAGHISPEAAAESPWRLLRMMNGATFKEFGIDNEPLLLSSPILKEETNTYTALHDLPGMEIPALRDRLQAAGKPEPFYVPDRTEMSGGRFSNRRATGFGVPGKSGSSRQNLGVLAAKGMLNVRENPLLSEYLRFRNFTEAQMIHDALIQHAAQLPLGKSLPHGWRYLRRTSGERPAPYTQAVGGEFEHTLDKGFIERSFTTDPNALDLMEVDGKYRLIVPHSVQRLLENRERNIHSAAYRLAYEHPTSVWKHLVLGLRPGFLTNNTVGNTILGALQTPARYGFPAWIKQIAPIFEKSFGTRVTEETMAKYLPEQLMGTFGRSSGFLPNKGLRTAGKLYQGVMPANIAYENLLRRVMTEAWAKSFPEFQDVLKRNGNDINAAFDVVAKTHPAVINDISKRVDDALGDYRTYGRLEQKVRQLIPFYGWDRHITRSVGRILSDNPALASAGVNLGRYGTQQSEAQNGPLPGFLGGAINLPFNAGPGRTSLLSTHGLNPFSTAADLGELAASLIQGKAGTSEEASSGTNPLITALIEQVTGKSLLTGNDLPKNGPGFGLLGNVAFNTATGIPQVTLAKALLGNAGANSPKFLYEHDWPSSLLTYLGVPVKKTNLPVANKQAREGK